MPRISRKYSSMGIYHVMKRGNNRKYIFMEKVDKEKFLEIIKKMNIKYASYYNKKYRTVGHVFQDRFKSEVVETDKYLFGLLRYRG